MGREIEQHRRPGVLEAQPLRRVVDFHLSLRSAMPVELV
jgi:hypothetical protein